MCHKESMHILIISNGRQKKWMVLKHNCNQIYSRYQRMTTPLTLYIPVQILFLDVDGVIRNCLMLEKL